MEVKEVIKMLEEAKNPFNENSLDYLSNREIDIVIGLLQQGEVYQKMWEELKKIYGDAEVDLYHEDDNARENDIDDFLINLLYKPFQPCLKIS